MGKNKDDIKYGSILTIFAAILGGVICFFAATKAIGWLGIVGIVITAIAILISLLTGILGITGSVIVSIVLLIIRKKNIAYYQANSESFLGAIFGSSSFLVYFNGICICVCLVLIINSFWLLISARE